MRQRHDEARHDLVWPAIAADVLHEAFALSRTADLFLAIGSSLVVEPAASLPRAAKEAGARLVIINRDATPLDPLADALLHQPIGEALAAIDAELPRPPIKNA